VVLLDKATAAQVPVLQNELQSGKEQHLSVLQPEAVTVNTFTEELSLCVTFGFVTE